MKFIILLTLFSLTAFAQVIESKFQVVDTKAVTFKPVDGQPEHCHAFLNGKFLCDTWSGCHPFATTLAAHATGTNPKYSVKTETVKVSSGATVKKCWIENYTAPAAPLSKPKKSRSVH